MSTVQVEVGGSIPTPSLHFSLAKNHNDIIKFVSKHHYAKQCGGANDFMFEAKIGNRLVGACVFGFLAGNKLGAIVVEGQTEPKLTRELRRLVLLDEAPKNSESQFIGWCLRWLKNNTNLIALISFADSSYNHLGIVYQATNWIYCGESIAHCPIYIINGKILHTRTLIATYGTEQIDKLKALGLNVSVKPRLPKYRYIYLLRDNLKLHSKLVPIPYPKR